MSCSRVLSVAILVVAVMTLLLATSTSAKKTKSTAKPFKDAIPFLRCQVCKTMVQESFDSVDAMRKNESRKTPLREEDILEEVTELVCNPFHEKGQWVRMSDIRVSEDLKNIGIVFHEEYGKCKRDCVTVAETCVAVLDSDQADDLPSMLYKGKKSVEQITKTVCSADCNKKWGKKGRKLKLEWAAEQFEEIDNKEMEIEAMMDNVQRTRKAGEPGMDFFSRDEMMNMQQAMRSGDLETLAELDPSASDLSPEDFAMLREMQADQQHEEDGPAATGASPSPQQAEDPMPAVVRNVGDISDENEEGEGGDAIDDEIRKINKGDLSPKEYEEYKQLLKERESLKKVEAALLQKQREQQQRLVDVEASSSTTTDDSAGESWWSSLKKAVLG